MNKNNNITKLVLVLFTLSVMGNFMFAYSMISTSETQLEVMVETLEAIEKDLVKIGRIEMYNTNISEAFGTTGLYHHNSFYCVWTRDRTDEEIERTEAHEICHALIAQSTNQSEHFCK